MNSVAIVEGIEVVPGPVTWVSLIKAHLAAAPAESKLPAMETDLNPPSATVPQRNQPATWW